MKEPKLNDLKLNKSLTNRIRSTIKKESIKITINIDSKTLARLKNIASRTGIPYQRLINQMLSGNSAETKNTISRLDKLEKELVDIKKKLAA